MKPVIYLIVCGLLACACSKKGESEILPIDTMVFLLQSLHIAKAKIDGDNSFVKNRVTEREILYSSVLKNEGIDQQTFAHSYDYYMDHPVMLDTIYVRVIRELNDQMRDDESREDEDNESGPSAIPPNIDVKKPAPSKQEKEGAGFRAR